jgi:hypothetical protein
MKPEAPDRQWKKYFRMGAEKIGWSRRHPTGELAGGPIKRGLGRRRVEGELGRTPVES